MDPNSQVLLSIGIPTIAVLIGILLNNRQIDALRGQFKDETNALRTHFDDKIDTRFNALQETMNARFATVDARFDAAHQALLRVEGVLDARLNRLEEERRR
jgi:hypothetical protein